MKSANSRIVSVKGVNFLSVVGFTQKTGFTIKYVNIYAVCMIKEIFLFLKRHKKVPVHCDFLVVWDSYIKVFYEQPTFKNH